jgi:hypothetical protein
MTDRRALVRQAVLLAVVLVATIGLLAGGAALLVRGRAGEPEVGSSPGSSAVTAVPSAGSSVATPGPSGSASGSPLASGEVPTIVITGAGDIAECPSDGAMQTSDLLLQQSQGSFFTAGDNAYEVGSPANFRDCYAPTWGRVLDRTILPTAGNHDWLTKDAAGYLGYFGPKAAPEGVTWYSMDRPRLRLRSGRRLRRELAAGPLAGPRPRDEHRELHPGDLAPPAVQLGRARRRPAGRPVLGSAPARRRRARRQRP